MNEHEPLHEPLEVTEEVVGDVVILRLHGRLTIGRPSELTQHCVTRLISAGRKKIILDMDDVPQIDSSGVHVCVRTNIALARSGGMLILAVGAGRVRDALTVTRLTEAIPTFDSVKAAIAAFSVPPFYCFCPICGSRSEPPAQNRKALYWEPQTCTRCDSNFTVSCEGTFQGFAILEKITILSYGKEDEYIEIMVGPRISVVVVGRLDLFSSRVLEKALHAIPIPRMVTIDLGRTTEISKGGCEALLAFLASSDKNDNVVISLEGLSPDRLETLSNLSTSAHLTKSSILGDLDRVPTKANWLIRVGRA